MDRNAIFRLLFLLIMSLSFSAVLQGCGTTTGITRVPSGNSITLTWQVPYTNNDSSEIVDLAGFKVYYGLISGDYTNVKIVKGTNSCRIDDLPGERMLYIAVTAFDTSRNESAPSDELETYLPPLQ
jgi:hypothetical protein